MSGRVLLRRDVPDDLHAIVQYLEQHSTAAADRFISSVFAAFEDLASMPGKGSPKQFRSRALEGVRSWAVPGFPKILILYRPIPEGIDVLLVAHGARDIRTLLRKRTQ